MRSPYCGGNLVIFHEFAAVFIRANTVVRFEAEDNRTRDQSWRPTSKPPPGPGSGTKQLVRNEASPRPLWCAPSCGQKRAPLAVGASAALRAGLRALRLHPCQCCGRRAQAAAQRCRSVGHVWQCREEPPGGTCESHRKAVASTSDALGGAWCAACVREPGSRAVWPSRGSRLQISVWLEGGRVGRCLPPKMQIMRGRSRVAIATLDPDSALRRTSRAGEARHILSHLATARAILLECASKI